MATDIDPSIIKVYTDTPVGDPSGFYRINLTHTDDNPGRFYSPILVAENVASSDASMRLDVDLDKDLHRFGETNQNIEVTIGPGNVYTFTYDSFQSILLQDNIQDYQNFASYQIKLIADGDIELEVFYPEILIERYYEF